MNTLTLAYQRLVPYVSFQAQSRQDTHRALRSARIRVTPEDYLLISLLGAATAGFAVFALAVVTGFALGLSGLSSLVVGTLSGALAGLSMRVASLAYPRARAKGRGRAIEQEFLPVVLLCYALAQGGMPLVRIFRTVAEEEETYGEISREFAWILRDVEWLGSDLKSAIRSAASTTPSLELKVFLEGLVTILDSGAEPLDYFRRQSDSLLLNAEMRVEKELDTSGLLAEFYVSGLLVLPLLLILMLSLLSSLGRGGSASMLTPVVYLLIPGGTLVYIVFLEVALPGISLRVPRPQASRLTDFGIAVLPSDAPLLPPPPKLSLQDVERERVALLRRLRRAPESAAAERHARAAALHEPAFDALVDAAEADADSRRARAASTLALHVSPEGIARAAREQERAWGLAGHETVPSAPSPHEEAVHAATVGVLTRTIAREDAPATIAACRRLADGWTEASEETLAALETLEAHDQRRRHWRKRLLHARVVVEWVLRRTGAAWRAWYARSRKRPFDAVEVSGAAGILAFAAGGTYALATGVRGLDLLVAATNFLLLGLLIALVPVSLFHELRVLRARRVEKALPGMLGKLAGLNERGIGLLRAFEILGSTASGPLAKDLRALQEDVGWNHSLGNALKRLRARSDTKELSKVSLLFERASAITSDLRDVLQVISHDAVRTENVRARLRSAMATYVIVVYLVVAVFFYVLYVVADLFFGPSGFGTADAFRGGIDPAQARVFFFHAALVQGVCAGLVAGRLGEGHLLSGLKHAVLLTAFAWIVFQVGVFS